MSIERTGGRNGTISFVCDECPEHLDTEQDDFGRAWAFAKSQGWRSFQVAGQWCHGCPSCVEDFAQRGGER